MKIFRNWKTAVILLLGPVLFAIPSTTLSKEVNQRWEILNPKGVVKIEPMAINPHPSTLEGKTIMLRWNGKHIQSLNGLETKLDDSDLIAIFPPAGGG